MLKSAKRFIAALCFVAFIASCAFAENPFRVYPEGFGPKIKGFQLGMRLSLKDLAEFAGSLVNDRNFQDKPVTIKIMRDNYSHESEDYIKITLFSEILMDSGFLAEDNSADFELPEGLTEGDTDTKVGSEEISEEEIWSWTKFKLSGRGSYSDLLNEKNLLHVLQKIEQRGYRYAFITQNGSFDQVRYFRLSSGRIDMLRYFKGDFGAAGMTDNEFLPVFLRAYGISNTSTINDEVICRNPREGWQLRYVLQGLWFGGVVMVEAIELNRPTFD